MVILISMGALIIIKRKKRAAREPGGLSAPVISVGNLSGQDALVQLTTARGPGVPGAGAQASPIPILTKTTQTAQVQQIRVPTKTPQAPTILPELPQLQSLKL